MNRWETVLKLNDKRVAVEGSAQELTRRLTAGADLRIGTAFYHNEHIDPSSPDHQLIEETSDFPQTIVLDSKWSAGMMTLRQPVSLKQGFGAGVHLSLFLYNQDGQQALATLALEHRAEPVSNDRHDDMDKMTVQAVHDPASAAPSKNFIYDFERYDFHVNSGYTEIYANDAMGNRTFGDMDALAQAYRSGKRIKIGISGLLRELYAQSACQDEVFVHCGCSYYYTEERLMITNSNPFVSLPGCIPLIYMPKSLNYCWAIAQSDGKVAIRRYDPYKQLWTTQSARLPVRWFAQE